MNHADKNLSKWLQRRSTDVGQIACTYGIGTQRETVAAAGDAIGVRGGDVADQGELALVEFEWPRKRGASAEEVETGATRRRSI
jgi:hypothetical protein